MSVWSKGVARNPFKSEGRAGALGAGVGGRLPTEPLQRRGAGQGGAHVELGPVPTADRGRGPGLGRRTHPSTSLESGRKVSAPLTRVPPLSRHGTHPVGPEPPRVRL